MSLRLLFTGLMLLFLASDSTQPSKTDGLLRILQRRKTCFKFAIDSDYSNTRMHLTVTVELVSPDDPPSTP
jgi:hypothetical protein